MLERLSARALECRGALALEQHSGLPKSEQQKMAEESGAQEGPDDVKTEIQWFEDS